MSFFLFPLIAIGTLTPLQEVEARLTIENTSSALKLMEKSFSKDQATSETFQLYLKVLSHLGKEKEMLDLWETFHARYPDKALEQEVLEELGWGVLRNGHHVGQSTNQLIALIGSTLTQDRYAVPHLLEALNSPSIPLRALAIQLSALMRDHELKSEIAKMIHQEKEVRIRSMAIVAGGELGLKEELPYLLSLLESPRVRDEEKKAAIQAIVSIKKEFTPTELNHLVSHPKAQMRLLAIEAFKRQIKPKYLSYLYTLLHDAHQDVAMHAVHCFGILGVKEIEGKSIIEEMSSYLHSSNTRLAITAAWYLLRNNSELGEKKMESFLFHKQNWIAREAAAAVAYAGPNGVKVANKALNNVRDPYIRLNLSLGLLGQRERLEEASNIIVEVMKNVDEKWMRDESSLFSPIVPSLLGHRPEIPRFPEMVNQKIRLELTHLLSLLNISEAQELLRMQLQDRQRGLTSLLSEVLLGVGDEVEVDHVYALLEDEDPKIRLEAALVLGAMAKDSSVLPHLIEAYHRESKQGKIQIMEVIGRLGERKAIPFFLEEMRHPSLNMRMVAASMLLLTLKQ